MDISVELVMNDFMELGEGPCWDEDEKALYWVDTDRNRVYRFIPETDEKVVYQLDQKVGAVAKEDENNFICALEHGFFRFNQSSGSQEFLADPEADKKDNLFNDGKCDVLGRFWAGTMNIYEKENEGALYCFTSDNQWIVKQDNVTISNGLAWTEDSKTMYYIDSATNQISAFDYNLELGEISNRRVIIEFTEDQGIPDGMTIDRNGNLWVAMWGGYSVLNCNPETGEILNKVIVPVSNVTSCTFGGDNLDILFITTAQAELTDEEKKEQPLAGGLFKADVGVRGYASNRFANND